MKILIFLCLISALASCDFIESLDRNRLAPEVSLEVGPEEGEAPLDVRFEYAASDPDGNPLECTLEFGDGASAELTSCKGVTFHTYAEPGGKVATFRAADGEFESVSQVGVRVTATPEDETELSLSASPEEGEAPLLVAFGWDSQGLSGSCTLDPGDGGEVIDIEDCETATQAFHTFEQAGGFVASLRWGGEGASVAVRVSGP